MKKYILFLILALALFAPGAAANPLGVKSPDRSLVFSVDISSDGSIVYSLSKDREPVLD